MQLHGDIHRVRCTFCSADFPCSQEYLDSFLTGTPPNCPECAARCESQQPFSKAQEMNKLICVYQRQPALRVPRVLSRWAHCVQP